MTQDLYSSCPAFLVHSHSTDSVWGTCAYTCLLAADTIRILVATDSHVGYAERDHIRGDDSWKTFHEVMCLAREKDVDMVLLAGDLFHDNKPSRKAMFNVMRSLRMNCYGEKPCELEMLSDSSEVFEGYSETRTTYSEV